MKKNEVYLMHWLDGMKLSSRHFEHINSFVEGNTAKTISVHANDYNYGLLSEIQEMLSVSINQANVASVKINALEAVLPSGYLLRISPEMNIGSECAIPSFTDIKESSLYLTIEINSERKIPFGPFNADENPPRQAYSRPDIQFRFVEKSFLNNISGTDLLPIAKVNFKGGKFELDNDYILPCNRVNSHRSLKLIYTQMFETITSVYNHSLKILNAGYNVDIKNISIYDQVLSLMRYVIECYSENYDSIKLFGLHRAPIETFSFILKLMRGIYYHLDTIKTSAKNDFYNYFKSRLNNKGFDLNSLSELFAANYDHNDSCIYLNNLLARLQNLDHTLIEISQVKDAGLSKSVNQKII